MSVPWRVILCFSRLRSEACSEDYEHEIYDAGSSRTLGLHSLSTPKHFFQKEAHQSAYKNLGSRAEMEIFVQSIWIFFDGDSEGTIWEKY